MSYLGQGPFQEFTNPPTKDSFTGDGSTTTFDMAKEVPAASQNALEVYVNNVRQEPGTSKAFTLGVDGSGDHKRITFTAAPANGAAIYVINDKTNTTTTAPLAQDLNGTELILDVDGDSSITADTDDRIDLKLGNVEHISFGNSSGDTVIKPMVDAKDILFQQYDGRTLLDINDGGYVAIANGATGPGQLRLYEDTDNGTNYSAFQVGTQSGDVTYTLPTADGTDGYQLTTDGSGALSWAAAGTTISNNTNNRVVTGTGSALNGEANLTFDGSTLALSGAMTSTGAITGSSTVQGTTITATTAFVPDASDGAALGTTSLEFSDLYLADGAVIGFGDDQDVTLTHVVDTGLLLSSTDQLQFGDSGTYIFQSADGVLDLVSDTEIEINATTIDINGNVEISGTATTTGVHTFTAVPVLPANSIDSAHYVDGSIDTAHIANDQITAALMADNSIDSDMYVDGSIDNAHIADDAVGVAELSATGTASSSTYLRGDNSWATISSFDPDGAQVFNETGADVDFRVESDTLTHALFVDGANGKIGLNQGVPVGNLHLKGSAATIHIEGTTNSTSRTWGLLTETVSGGDLDFQYGTSLGANPSVSSLRLTNDGRGLSQFTAKGWANWDQTGTLNIRDHHNVSSMVDNGTGETRVNWDVDLANANYAVTVGSRSTTSNQTHDTIAAQDTAYFIHQHYEGGTPSSTDGQKIMIIAFGD